MDPTNLCLAIEIIVLGGIVTDIWSFKNVIAILAAILDISISPWCLVCTHQIQILDAVEMQKALKKQHWVGPTLWLSPLATRLYWKQQQQQHTHTHTHTQHQQKHTTTTDNMLTDVNFHIKLAYFLLWGLFSVW